MRSHLLLLSASLTLFACADPLKADEDADGVTAVDDCDDNDPSVGAIAEDADCDGVVTAADCDDGNPLVPNQAGCWQQRRRWRSPQLWGDDFGCRAVLGRQLL